MNEQQLMQLAQALIAKDPQAMEIFKQLPKEQQQMVMQIVQQLMAQQQGAEQQVQPQEGNMIQQSMQTPMMRSGGKIYIKPSKRGSLRKATGTKKDEKIPLSKLKIKKTDSPAMKKKKQFALNARKWKK